MKKVVVSCLVVQMALFAGVVFAECVTPAQLVGKWQISSVEGLFADEGKIKETMDSLTSGKVALDALLKDTKDAKEILSGTIEILEAGEVAIAVVGAGSDSPITVQMQAKATWKLDCDKLITQITSLDEVKMALKPDAKLAPEEKAELEEQPPEIEAQMKAEAQKKDSSLYEQGTEKIFYVSESYVLTKVELTEEKIKNGQIPSFTIYKKQ